MDMLLVEMCPRCKNEIRFLGFAFFKDRCGRLKALFHEALPICCGWQYSLYMVPDVQLVMGTDGHLPVWCQL